jgi:hypothetical protein
MRPTHQAWAHPPSHRPMILALRSVSRLRPRGPVGGAYIGLLGSLLGPSSAVPSSWALQTTCQPWSSCFGRGTERGKKAGSSDACNLRNLPMIAVLQTWRVQIPHAVWFGVRERLLLSVWVVGGCGVCRCFVCGVSSSFPNGNLKLCVRWASLSHRISFATTALRTPSPGLPLPETDAPLSHARPHQ